MGRYLVHEGCGNSTCNRNSGSAAQIDGLLTRSASVKRMNTFSEDPATITSV